MLEDNLIVSFVFDAPTIIDPALSKTILLFEREFADNAQPAIFPAFAVICPDAASSVTELDPLATFNPDEFNANPLPVRLPFELIVPLYIEAPAVDSCILPPIFVLPSTPRFPLILSSAPFQSI